MRTGMPLALAVVVLAMFHAPARAGDKPVAPAAGQRENVEIRNIRILTDGSVDCNSPEAIAAATLKGTNDEQKVLGFWHWYRRVEWHYKEWPERRDLTANLLSQGQTLCGSHAALQMLVLRAGGYKTRPCFVEGGGHTFIEVFYDDRWHALDAMTGFYVYSRSSPRYILSLDEMRADPGLVTTAAAEGRAPEVFLPCAREPEIKKRKTLPWSHFKPFEQTVAYYAEGAKRSSSGGEKDAYGGSFTAGKMNINLRPGETVTRKWDMEPGRFPLGWAYPEDVATGPFHRCGHNDEFDKVNFPYWEPYCKKEYFVYNRQGTNENTGPVTMTRCYRYLANGRFDRNLPAADLLALASATNGVALKDNALAAAGPGTGTVEIATSFPYFICDADVTLKYNLKSDSSALVLQVMENVPPADKKAPARVEPRTVFETRKRGAAAETARIGQFDYGRLGARKYTLRLLLAGDAALDSMSISTVFAHNMFAGPSLVPGRNKVTVTADNGDQLAKHPLLVTCVFADGENWAEEKTVRKEVAGSPFEFEIQVAGPKHPRMISVSVEAR